MVIWYVVMIRGCELFSLIRMAVEDEVVIFNKRMM